MQGVRDDGLRSFLPVFRFAPLVHGIRSLAIMPRGLPFGAFPVLVPECRRPGIKRIGAFSGFACSLVAIHCEAFGPISRALFRAVILVLDFVAELQQQIFPAGGPAGGDEQLLLGGPSETGRLRPSKPRAGRTTSQPARPDSWPCGFPVVQSRILAIENRWGHPARPASIIGASSTRPTAPTRNRATQAPEWAGGIAEEMGRLEERGRRAGS